MAMPGGTETRREEARAQPAPPRRSTSAAVVAFSATLAALALLGYFGIVRTHLDTVGAPFRISWIALAAGFAVADLLAIHIEIGDDAHSFTLSEVPLVIGMFLCTPSGVVLGRVVGAFIVLAVIQRQRPIKLWFNLSLAALESVCAVATLAGAQALLGEGVVSEWSAVLVAVCSVTALQSIAIPTVIRLASGVRERGLARRMAMYGFVSTAATASLGIASVTLLTADRAAGLVPITVIGAVLYASYRGYAVVTQRYANLQKLYDFTKLLARTPELESSMRVTLREARDVLRAQRADLCLIERDDDDDGFLRVSLAADDTLEVTADHDLSADWVRAEVVAEQRPVVIPRGSREPAAARYLAEHGVTDLVMVPLVQSGGVVGTVAVYNRLGEVSTFDDDDVKMFETLANHVSISLENARLIDRLRSEVAEKQHQALHDPLTALGNRTLFATRAAQAVRESRTAGWRVAVLLMDLNRFKEVNDTLGHQQGDTLLRQVAARLRASSPPAATIARLGGDEFVVLIPQIRSAREAEQVAIEIQLAMQQPFQVDELQLAVTGAIGIAVTPDHGDDPATLLQHADIAMYQAKEGRDSGVQLYDNRDNQHSHRRLALASALKEALDGGELSVHYQPKADLRTNRVVGVEALLRWEHPRYGAVPPDEFIPLAESTGLMRRLTAFVLRESLEQLARWHELGFTELHVAVNLSARSLIDLELADEIQELLVATGVPAANLTLEITETQMMADTSRTLVVLERLNELGTQISIDDFGTGYSSLTYLKRLPVHEVKIDRSFVDTMSSDDANATIVRSIIDLGRNLSLRVVAEGVEDGITWEALAALDCDIAQGYFLSKPIPPQRLTPWLVQRRALHDPLPSGERRMPRIHAVG
jgi:diguanylate cyclase (GGDEF)-like protein